MEIRHEVSLKDCNTFGIATVASTFCVLRDLADLQAIAAMPVKYIIGGGSNVLLPPLLEGLVVRNELKGKQVLADAEEDVLVAVASGEIWHEFVLYALDHGWYGIENLALIPGTVGAAPIQNIGAYGVEVKDIIEWVEYYHWETKQLYRITNGECRFGYRDSIFKQELAKKVFITHVCFRLKKNPALNTSYGAIEAQLKSMGIVHAHPLDVAHAVMHIRRSKLPDPQEIGNAGSFFKNPTIPLAQYEELKSRFPEMPAYVVNEQFVKVPAGWLIEYCGWKGFRDGDAGVHQLQSLVLVNYGSAESADIWALSERIVQSVYATFGIMPEREVQVW
jgi:UDP-N-acetylmuramate dehydrogenase